MPDASHSLPLQLDVVIVGAGLAGLYAIHRLRRQGLDVLCLEAADDVGGGAGVIFIDVGEAEIGLVAAIRDRQQQHDGNGEDARPKEELAAIAAGPAGLALGRANGARRNRLIQGVKS